MSIVRLRECVQELTVLADSKPDESRFLQEGKAILSKLITHDDWLPEFAGEHAADGYRQYLLHCDPHERFSVVSFVWGPAQKTPIHNHTVWGLVGVLRGLELSRRFEFDASGALTETGCEQMGPGEIDMVSPAVGDIHEVANGLSDRASISIHVYGANIGRVQRNVFDPQTGQKKSFVSGYSKAFVPNLWSAA